MEHKIQELLGDNRDVKVSTFHSFCAEIIRDNPDKCNITDDFTIIEEIDSAIFLHKEAGIDIKNAAFYTISKAKDLNIPITKFKEYIATKKAHFESTTQEDEWDNTYHDFKVKLNTFHLKSKENQKPKKQTKTPGRTSSPSMMNTKNTKTLWMPGKSTNTKKPTPTPLITAT